MGAFFSSYHVYTQQWNGHLRLVLQVNLDFPVFVVGQLYKVFLSLALLIIHSALSFALLGGPLAKLAVSGP